MPTPIGHFLITGSALTLSSRKFKLKEIFFLFLIGFLPDVDLIVGKLRFLRKLGFYHQGITHTFLAAVIISVLIYFLSSNINLALLSFLVYSLHLIADLFMIDTRPPIGFAPFYPFSRKLINFGIIPGAEKGSLSVMFSQLNLHIIMLEAFIFASLYILVQGVKQWIGEKP